MCIEFIYSTTCLYPEPIVPNLDSAKLVSLSPVFFSSYVSNFPTDESVPPLQTISDTITDSSLSLGGKKE